MVMRLSPSLESEADGDHFTAIVVAAGGAQVVRALQFATVRALVESFDLQRIMAAAHAPAGGTGLSFGDSHFGTFSSKTV
jgi:hypothetical protein